MQVHRNIEQLPLFRNAVITIGTFDGVHMGHRQIIAKLKEEAAKCNGETVIITFHPHPRKIVAQGTTPIKLINTLDEKIELLETLGINHLVVVPFTEHFSNQSAEDYVREFLILRFQPHTIIIGYDHRFGKARSGNYLLLEEKAPVYNYILKEIPKHVLDEIAISSTKIRESLQEGQTAIAEKLLGYQFFFDGKVIHGDKIGRTLGYPTANLEVEDAEKLIPCDGIYAVYVETGKSKVKSKNSKPYAIDSLLPTPDYILPTPDLQKGMMSIGFRPTVNGKKRVIEVNIFDFDEDIYGETIRVYVKKYLRAEVKFDSLEALVKQIDLDKIESLKVL